LKVSFEPLKLNIIYGNTVSFLDLSINFDKITQHLEFRLFIKSTNTFSYLLNGSNHPEYIYDNIPKSIFIRIRRICSSFLDYLYFSTLITKQLVLRGYSFNTLRKISNTVGKIERNSLIPYKSKNDSNTYTNNDYILFKLPFDLNFKHDKDKLFKLKNIYIKNKNFEGMKIRFFNSMQSNLSSLLIHNFRFPKIVSYKNKKCEMLNCETCNFICTDSFIFLKNGFLFPINCNGDCNSTMAIYIIRCTLCNAFYIGKTETTIKKRLKLHFSMIRNFLPFKYNCHSDIDHFNLVDHNYKAHLKFYIYRCSFLTTEELLTYENIIINFFSIMNPPIMNDFIPFLNRSHKPIFSIC
jgi:hypothetical protein